MRAQFPIGLIPGFFRQTVRIFLVFLCMQTASFAQQNKMQASTGKVSQKESRDEVFEKKKILISVLEKQETDWNRGDMNAFLSAYWHSDTLVTVNVRGVQYGMDGFERYMKRNYPDTASMGHLEYEVFHISLIGENDALLTGKWLRKNNKKFRGGYFSILLRRMHNRWMIISEHLG